MARSAYYNKESFWSFGLDPMGLFEAYDLLKLGAYMPVIEVVENDGVRYEKVVHPEFEDIDYECWVLSQAALEEMKKRLAEDKLPPDYSDFVAAVLEAVDDDGFVYLVGDYN